MSDPPPHPTTPSPAVRVLSLVVSNERREIPRIGERLAEFGDACGLLPDDVASVNLAIDELVSNVINYAYDDADVHQIQLTVTVEGDVLTLTIGDEGRAFNPIEAPMPDLDQPIEKRPIGGLGIFLVKSVADTLAYRREGGHNILTLTKRVSRRAREK
jgi:anti-sigma regulatory factor (Ser/Thr protein kinase)